MQPAPTAPESGVEIPMILHVHRSRDNCFFFEAYLVQQFYLFRSLASGAILSVRKKTKQCSFICSEAHLVMQSYLLRSKTVL